MLLRVRVLPYPNTNPPHLTFTTGLEINSLELNYIYEYLYDLGIMLQTESCFQVFDDEFRSWPHLYKNKGRSKKFYAGVDSNLKSDLQRIRLNPEREDNEEYNSLMREVLGCFGFGIVESLRYYERLPASNGWTLA